jgi:hypothetical protein
VGPEKCSSLGAENGSAYKKQIFQYKLNNCPISKQISFNGGKKKLKSNL